MQPDIESICGALVELQVRRKFWIGVINKQTNALGALVRRMLGFRNSLTEAERARIRKRAAALIARSMKGEDRETDDAVVAEALKGDFGAFMKSLEPAELMRHEIELQMKRTVRSLPIRAWAASVRGLGELGLAVIIGEAGNLSNYSSVRKLWRRLGLGMAQGHEDHAYSTWRMHGGLTADEWSRAGYSPRRRAEIHACVAEPLFRQQTIITGPYRQAYNKRRASCEAKHPDWTKAHLHMDGLRIMTKVLLSDLWSEWRRSKAALEAAQCVAASTEFGERSESRLLESCQNVALAEPVPSGVA